MNHLIAFICIVTFALICPTIPTEVVYANLNQDYLYTCPDIGTPRSDIQWTVGGNGLNANSSSYTIFPDGSLLITPITESISGLTEINSCCLSDECNGFFIFLTVINSPIAHDTSGVESSDITLSCDSNSSLPRPTFSWYRNGAKISGNRETVLIKVTRLDAGVYTCSIMNAKGNKSVDIQVTIEYASTTEIVGEQYRFVSAGSTVELSCNFDGLPNPVVSWSVGSDSVFSNALQILNPALSYPSGKSVTLTLPSISYNKTGYYFCFANNTHGDSDSFIRVTVQTKPEPPQVSVSSEASRNFTITWSYRDNGNSHITRILIDYRPSTMSTWENRSIVGNSSTEYTPNQLIANSLYIIRVSVENAIGRSLTVMVTAQTLPLAPPVPRGVWLRVVSHVILELVWEAPLLTSEHTPILQYECQLKPASASVWNSMRTLTQTQFSYSFLNLSPATLYQARVRCANSVGYSEPWVQVENRTNFTAPGPPVLAATVLDFKKIRVSWTPASDGGVPLDSWTVEISSNSLEWEDVGTFPASQLSFVIDNLEANTSYYIRVRVNNLIGSSPFILTRATTQAKSPLGVVDSNITAVSITSTSIQVSWLPVEYTDIAVSLEYEISYSLLSESLLPTHTVYTDVTSYTFQGLLPLSTYRFSIRVRDGAEVSDRAVVFRLTTTLPTLTISLTPTTPVLGSRAGLSCAFTELYRGVYEPAYVSWYKGGVHLDQASGRVEGGTGYFYLYQHHLVFPTFHTSHYGNYSCRVGSQLAFKSVGGRSIVTSSNLWNDHMEAFVIAIALGSMMILFICVFSTILCCIFCVRRRRKAQNARYPVGIPTKSWLNPTSAYSPLRSEQTGFNPLKLETLPPHRPSVLEGSPEAEPTYTTSFLHNLSPGGTSPDETVGRLAAPQGTVLPGHVAVERYEGESNGSTPGPPLPPPFSAEDVFGDDVSLPKRLTITEGMTSLRIEKNPPPSPPSSARTAPTYENFSRESPSPLYQHAPEESEQPQDRFLYQNIPMEIGAQHVTGVEMIQIPNNCISTDI